MFMIMVSGATGTIIDDGLAWLPAIHLDQSSMSIASCKLANKDRRFKLIKVNGQNYCTNSSSLIMYVD